MYIAKLLTIGLLCRPSVAILAFAPSVTKVVRPGGQTFYRLPTVYRIKAVGRKALPTLRDLIKTLLKIKRFSLASLHLKLL